MVIQWWNWRRCRYIIMVGCEGVNTSQLELHQQGIVALLPESAGIANRRNLIP